VWLRPVLEELETFDRRTSHAAEQRLREHLVPLARRHGKKRRVVEAVWLVESRRWKLRVASPVSPERIRAIVFAKAARLPRTEALAEASAELAISPGEIEAWLFSDRARERLLEAPEERRGPHDLAHAYNLALAQSLLTRCSSLAITVREHARHVVGYAKLRGLMASFEQRDEGVNVALSGPLALFHDTIKYGRALAGVLPTLATTTDWKARASIVLDGRSLVLDLDATSPIGRTHALPRRTDSAVERRLVRDLRAAPGGWTIVREDTVVRVGRRLFYPDFTLASSAGRVLVEVVGYWTPEYLASKIEALAAVDVPIVVCVDERHANGPLEKRRGVITFRERVDVAELLDAAGVALCSGRPGMEVSSESG
jgi:predicted nuclease of restriction endonuclease-like RecB superfamily